MKERKYSRSVCPFESMVRGAEGSLKMQKKKLGRSLVQIRSIGFGEFIQTDEWQNLEGRQQLYIGLVLVFEDFWKDYKKNNLDNLTLGKETEKLIFLGEKFSCYVDQEQNPEIEVARKIILEKRSSAHLPTSTIVEFFCTGIVTIRNNLIDAKSRTSATNYDEWKQKMSDHMARINVVIGTNIKVMKAVSLESYKPETTSKRIVSIVESGRMNDRIGCPLFYVEGMTGDLWELMIASCSEKDFDLRQSYIKRS